MKFTEKLSRVCIAGAACFCVVMGIFILVGWCILCFSALEASLGVPGWVWAALAAVVGIAGGAATLGDGR